MMATNINGKDFYNFFKSGTGEVVKQKETLNDINVFPVKDGDTGTNLVMTMRSIVDEAEISEDFDVVIKSMSDVALESARGNSGLIFASFINGFSSACGSLKVVNMEQFSHGATIAAKEAYGAVSMPVEGTILTVMREWAEYIGENHKKHHSFKELFEGAYAKAKRALEETPEKLEILKKSKVVDSGAKGFVFFLEGINHFVSGLKESALELVRSETTQEKVGISAVEENNSELAYRYCTEFTLKTSVQEKAIVESILTPFGDSVVVSGNDRLLKVHLHTNTPDQVAASLIQKGYVISKSKIDDMRLQTLVETNPKAKVGIFTDSIADIEPSLLLEEQIHVMPLSLISDENLLLDKLTVNEKNIAALLDHSKTYPTSSQPDVNQVRARLEWLCSHYEEVVVLSVAKALSGTYNSFEKAIEPLKAEGHKIHLIDTKLNTAGEGMMVLKAAQMANSGASAEAIVKAIESDIPKTDVYVSLDTFKYAVKSGRVPNKIGNLFMKLNAKPIMSLKRTGEGTAFGLAFSRESIDRKIMKVVKKIHESEGVKAYTIVHAGNPELAKAYVKRFEALLGKPPIYVTPISAVTTIHAGMGSVAIALVRGR